MTDTRREPAPVRRLRPPRTYLNGRAEEAELARQLEQLATADPKHRPVAR